jgi:hypothetical protein
MRTMVGHGSGSQCLGPLKRPLLLPRTSPTLSSYDEASAPVAGTGVQIGMLCGGRDTDQQGGPGSIELDLSEIEVKAPWGVMPRDSFNSKHRRSTPAFASSLIRRSNYGHPGLGHHSAVKHGAVGWIATTMQAATLGFPNAIITHYIYI